MDLHLLHPTVFRALGSARRVAILRTLAERPHTPAELARRLGVTEPTIQYHLDRLASAGLSGRRPDGRPWAYHQLTAKGRSLVESAARPAPLAVLAFASAALSATAALLWANSRPAPLPPGTIGLPLPAPWWSAVAGGSAMGLAIVALATGFAWLALRRGRAAAAGSPSET